MNWDLLDRHIRKRSNIAQIILQLKKDNKIIKKYTQRKSLERTHHEVIQAGGWRAHKILIPTRSEFKHYFLYCF